MTAKLKRRERYPSSFTQSIWGMVSALVWGTVDQLMMIQGVEDIN